MLWKNWKTGPVSSCRGLFLISTLWTVTLSTAGPPPLHGSTHRREDEVDVAHEVENDDEFEGEEERETWEREIMILETEKEKGKGKGRGKKRGKSVSYGTPNSDDWKVVELYVEVLRVFFVVTERFSGSLYVTSNTFFKEVMTIKKAIATLQKSDDPKLLMLANDMNKKYDKYWGTFGKINQLLLYANVLDPHFGILCL
ncbi:hypothetical protein Vadar_034105 [Vaccinium darrowii]|uniref:Uncharacterized protein n=1 Tax=Vaccinium darrowii TaxID=229202 RepID=A0ACB7XLX4_9ERIC|nr:hypothetical protein Vadar_034105 [Vaccinium darrowii]